MSTSAWDIKYKPRNLDEYIGQDNTRTILRRMSEQIWLGEYQIPHFLFSGGHGYGKTTLVYAFLRHTFGDAWRTNLLEMNSSTANIDNVRNEVAEFCRTARIGTYKTPSGQVCDIPYNFVFLDEFDGITSKSQFALRRIMEDYPRVRFILSCNYIHKILKPIQDRCMQFPFIPFTIQNLSEMIDRIARGEGIKISSEDIELIAKNSNGSARRAQKLLQKAVLCKSGDAVTRDDITKNLIADDRLDSTVLVRILVANATGDLKEYEASCEELCDTLDEYNKAGHSGEDVLKMMVEDVKQRDFFPDEPERTLAARRYLTMGVAEALYRGGFTNDIYFYIEMWARSLGYKE